MTAEAESTPLDVPRLNSQAAGSRRLVVRCVFSTEKIRLSSAGRAPCLEGTSTVIAASGRLRRCRRRRRRRRRRCHGAGMLGGEPPSGAAGGH